MKPCTSVPGVPVVFNDSLLEVLKFFDAPSIPQKPGWEIALKVVFYIIAIVADVVGNVTVILIIYLNQRMKTTTNILIFNLAVSDIMVAMFCMWVHLGNQITTVWPFGAFMCKFATFVQVLSVTLSVLTLTCVSIERFLAIVFPLRGKLSTKGTYLCIAITWLVSITIASPHLFIRELFEMEFRNRKDIVCQENWPKYYTDTHCNSDEPGKKIYYTIECVVMYIIPVLVIVVAYGVIIVKLTIRKTPGNATINLSITQDKTRRKVLKMLLVVVIVFVICWTPQQTFLLWDVYRDNIKVEQLPDYVHTMKYIAVYLAYFNSAVNPIIYGALNENFRRGFKEAFKCQLLRNRNRVHPVTTTRRTNFALNVSSIQSSSYHLRSSQANASDVFQ